MPKNILVVDDEPLIARSLERLLKSKGFNPFVATSFKGALEIIKDVNVDLVISDVRMPGSDGIDVIKEIRGYLRHNNKNPIPEILITGYADEELYKKALSLGVNHYIYKPFDTSEFLNIIKDTLEEKSTLTK